MTAESRVRATTPRLVLVFVLLLAACQPSAVPSSVTPSLAAVPTPSVTAEPSATAAPTERPTPTPLPSAVPRPTDIPTDGTCEAPHTCLGLISPGAHHTQAFKPGFTFTMAATGWENLSDVGGVLALLPIDNPGDEIVFFREPKATSPDGTAVFSVDISVDAIQTWLATNKALTVGPTMRVSIGGLKGVSMDIAVAPSASPTANCPVQTCVSIFKGVDPAAVKAWQWDWGTATSERQRLYLLTTADGGVIAIFVDSLDGTTFDALTKSADTILATIRFDKP